MKKFLTLCLAFAMTFSVGAFALTTLGSPVAKAAETPTETPTTLTVKAATAYAYATETPETHNDFTANQSFKRHYAGDEDYVRLYFVFG